MARSGESSRPGAGTANRTPACLHPPATGAASSAVPLNKSSFILHGILEPNAATSTLVSAKLRSRVCTLWKAQRTTSVSSGQSAGRFYGEAWAAVHCQTLVGKVCFFNLGSRGLLLSVLRAVGGAFRGSVPACLWMQANPPSRPRPLNHPKNCIP